MTAPASRCGSCRTGRRCRAAGQPAQAGPAGPPAVTRTPRNQAELEALLRLKPLGWEHLYYAGRLLQERDAIEDKYRDYLCARAVPTGEAFPLRHVDRFVDKALAEAKVLSGILRVVTQQRSPAGSLRCVGPTRRPSHVSADLAKRYNDMYGRVPPLGSEGPQRQCTGRVQERGRTAHQAWGEPARRLPRLCGPSCLATRHIVCRDCGRGALQCHLPFGAHRRCPRHRGRVSGRKERGCNGSCARRTHHTDLRRDGGYRCSATVRHACFAWRAARDEMSRRVTPLTAGADRRR